MPPAATRRPAAPWAREIYSALTWGVQPLLRRKLRHRARSEPLYAQAIAERFGEYQPADLGHDGHGQWLWIHAVSLGETHAAGILLAALRQRMPGVRLLLTHGTASGRQQGQQLLRPGDVQVWQPWDSKAATQRFVQQFRPALGVLMETEVWPNLVAACADAGVPLVLANARLSDKSLNQALRLAPLARPAYRALTAVWAQSEADARRLRSLGAPVQAVLGNLKFDARPDDALLHRAQQWRQQQADARPVLLLASSRQDEEAMWLAALGQPGVRAALAQQPVRLLVVPRHPPRFDDVAGLLRDAGFQVLRRSQWADGLPPMDAGGADNTDNTVWLGDSLGEMALYYGLADVALLGGSFAPLGGQNLMEALACDCPVVMGPHTFNFTQASALACAAGAAWRAGSIEQAVQLALQLAADRAAHAQAVERARRFLQQHGGAARASAEAIAALLHHARPAAAGLDFVEAKEVQDGDDDGKEHPR